MEDNKTLKAYEEDAQGYVDKTPVGVQGDKKEWIEEALKSLPKDALILELGSGFGRDADYIESLGYKVQRSEAAKSFVEMMQRQGHKPLKLNALTDDYGGPYDMVYANAVLLHFTVKETKTVLAKVLAALKHNGRFAVRLKEGEGSEWDEAMSQPRFMQYWREENLRTALTEAGFEINFFKVGVSKFNKFGWLQVVARNPHLN